MINTAQSHGNMNVLWMHSLTIKVIFTEKIKE